MSFRDLEEVFGDAPVRATPDALTTAHALTLFHDELITRGFTPVFARQLVASVAVAEVQRSGLAVTLPTQQ